MIEIEKLRQGRKISISEYNQAKLDFDDLYANASDEDKAKIDGLMRSSQNYSSANPMNNRSTREYQTQVYKNAAAILRGEMTPSMAPTVSTPNWFNGYSSEENQNNANYVTQRYLSHAGNPTTKITSTPAPSRGTYHRYNWANGLSSGWTLDSDTLEQRMQSFAETLSNNLNTALSAKNSGKKLIGVDENNVELALSMLQGKQWNKDNFKELMKAAQLAGVDPSAFRDYFGDLFPGMSAEDRAKKALTDNGYELVDNFNFGDYTNDFANYKVAKKGNQYYLINSDYSGPVTNAGKVFMNTDWRDPSKEGHGYIIGNDGSFIIGDLNQYYNDSQSPYLKQLLQYVKDQNNEARVTWKNYDRLTDLSNYDIIENNSAALSEHSVADMSRYFDTEVPIVATIEGDDWENSARTRFGHTRLDDSRIKYYWGDGKSGSYQDLINDLHINPNLTKSEPGRNYTNWSSAGLSLAQLEPETEDFWNKDVNRFNQFLNFFSNNLYRQTNRNLWTKDKIDPDQDINKNPDAIARLLVQLKVTDDNKLTDEQRKIKNRWWTKYEKDALYLIAEQLRKNPDLFKGDHEKDYLQAWHAILKAYRNKLPDASGSRSDIAVEKEGGILKAAEGTYIDLQGNQYTNSSEKLGGWASSVREKANKMASEANRNTERALANGRDPLQQKEIDRNVWTSSDTLRATALATDIAGLVAAIAGPETGGAGSVVAVGAGFASMAQDAIADFTDEKVSKGQAWKNVGINTGLAVGAMFGAKAPKMVKSAMKIVPKAMIALGAAGVVLDPEVQKTVDKITSGKGLNVNDWKNISIILRTATGIATVGTMSYKGRKGSEYAKSIENKKLQEITSDLDPNIKYIGTENGKKAIPINKDLHADITRKLSSGKEEDINDALATLMKSKEQGDAGLSEADAKSVLFESAKLKKGLVEKLKFWKEPETETSLREATSEQIENLTGRDLRAEAKLAAIADIRANAQARTKFDWARRLEGTKVAENLNPALNQALYGTGYKNIRELVTEENKLVKPYSATDLKNGIALNEAEVAAANKEIHTAMKPKGASIVASEGQSAAVADVRTKKSELRATEKSERQLNKQLADAEAKQQAAELELAKANEEFELANKRLSTGANKEKVLKQLKRAEQRLQNAQKKAQDAQEQFTEIEAVYSSPEFRSLYGKKSGSFTISKNSSLSQQLAQLEKDKNDLASQKEAMRSSLLFRRKYDSNGNPVGKSGAHIDLENQLTAATEAYNKAKKQRFIGGSDLWREYQTRKQNVDNTSKSVTELNNLIGLLKAQLAVSGPDIRSAKLNQVNALAKHQQAVNIAKGIKDQLSALGENKNNKLKELETSRKNLAKVNDRIKAKISAERMTELRSRGKTLTSSKPATIVVDGANRIIPTGTKTTSFAHIQNESQAKKVAMHSPTTKELSRSEIEKLYPSNISSQIRGAAYDTATGELVVWKQGGLINSKYSHLRK